MKYEIEFTQAEYTALTSHNVSDEAKLAIYQRKFDAINKDTSLMGLLNDLHIRCMDFFNYITEQCEDKDMEKLMDAYKSSFIKTTDDLKYYLKEIISKGIDDTRSLCAKSDLFSILNRVRRAYDHAEPFFCKKGIAFVDINEKRVGIDNCVDKIVDEFIICFESDEDTIRENA